jgi:hypothetical protein
MEMIEVTIPNTDVTRCLEIVHELRDMGIEFEYKFYQGGYNWEMNEHKTYKTVFSFHSPADATVFSLKYL